VSCAHRELYFEASDDALIRCAACPQRWLAFGSIAGVRVTDAGARIEVTDPRAPCGEVGDNRWRIEPATET
jgi:hypothetical protein